MEKDLMIRISNNKIFLTEENFLSLSQTNLFSDYLSFNERKEIYLKIEILSYENTSRLLHIEVNNYEPKDTKAFKSQAFNYEVDFIHFKPLVWTKIEKYLGSFTKGQLIKQNIVTDECLVPVKTTKFRVDTESFSKYLAPHIEKITEEGTIHFKDIEFDHGLILFYFKPKSLREKILLKIENPVLRKEFNLIKPYFEKLIGRNGKFKISISITLENKFPIEIKTASPEIDSIDESLIDSIKIKQIKKVLSNSPLVSSDKALYDLTELYSQLTKEGNVLQSSEKETIDILINLKQPRNTKQLQYLSSEKHSPNHRLYFTINPNFGFLFTIIGSNKHHYCWELLNSHATYLWSFEREFFDLNFQKEIVENAISEISVSGRDNYKSNLKKSNPINGFNFEQIAHSDISINEENSFRYWKEKLDNLL